VRLLENLSERRRARGNDEIALDVIIKFIEAEPGTVPRVEWFRWSRSASDEELRQLADRLFRESDPARIKRYLQVFRRGILAHFDARFLELADHPDREVRWFAVGVLDEYCDPAIRGLALSRLQNSRFEDGEIRLLEKNYEVGDHELIESLTSLVPVGDHLHSFTMGVLDIYEANETQDAIRLLLFVYEHTPCSLCRERSVKQLLKQDALPDWVRNECPYDASEDVRELVQDA